MKENKETIKNLPLLELEGKKVLILTQDNLTYNAKIISVFEAKFN